MHHKICQGKGHIHADEMHVCVCVIMILLYYVILHTILPHASHIVKIETSVVVGDIKLMQRNCETRTKKVCRDVPSSSGECVDTCSDACQWVWTWRHAGPDVEVLEKICKVPTCRNTCKKLKRHVSNSDCHPHTRPPYYV